MYVCVWVWVYVCVYICACEVCMWLCVCKRDKGGVCGYVCVKEIRDVYISMTFCVMKVILLTLSLALVAD